MLTDENVSLFAQTAATALKNGVQLDTASLNSLQLDSLDMIKSATAVSNAAQDLCTQEQRAPIFDHMPEIVTGSVSIEDAISQVLENMSE